MPKKLMSLNPKKRALVIPVCGFGDGLIMLIAASFLKEEGYEVTIINNFLPSLSDLLPFYTLLPFKEEFPTDFFYDMIILQNDNSLRAKKIISSKKEKKINLKIFYPSYKPSKHGPLTEDDFAFDPSKTMADNVFLACKKLFPNSKKEDKKAGVILPNTLTYQKWKKRVVLHPFSGDSKKNWPLKKYLKLAKKLSKAGFEPTFVFSEKEQSFFPLKLEKKAFNSLKELLFFIYESKYFIGNDSGPGHLASYLEIPSLIISDSKKRMQLWQPGWKKAKLITPPIFVPNIKGFRLREKKWTFCIPVFFVFKEFKKLIKSLSQ